MKISATKIPDVLLIEPKVFKDERGFFVETFQQQRYREEGLALPFVQDNHSRSSRGVLRGLHCQLQHPQGKLVSVLRGEIFDVAVDIRLGSPTFGQWVGVLLNDNKCQQLYVPPGFAHGFCVLSDVADVYYKCTDYYAPNSETGVLWNDPTIGIQWPLENPILSEKDNAFLTLANKPRHELPRYEGTR